MKTTGRDIGGVPIRKDQSPRRLINAGHIIQVNEKALVGSIQLWILIGNILQESGKLNELAGRMHRDLVGRFRSCYEIDVPHGQAEGSAANIITK